MSSDIIGLMFVSEFLCDFNVMETNFIDFTIGIKL